MTQGYSQKEVADKIEVTTRTVNRWEGGSEPSLGAPMRRLAALLRVSPGFLLNGEED